MSRAVARWLPAASNLTACLDESVQCGTRLLAPSSDRHTTVTRFFDIAAFGAILEHDDMDPRSYASCHGRPMQLCPNYEGGVLASRGSGNTRCRSL